MLYFCVCVIKGNQKQNVEASSAGRTKMQNLRRKFSSWKVKNRQWMYVWSDWIWLMGDGTETFHAVYFILANTYYIEVHHILSAM